MVSFKLRYNLFISMRKLLGSFAQYAQIKTSPQSNIEYSRQSSKLSVALPGRTPNSQKEVLYIEIPISMYLVLGAWQRYMKLDNIVSMRNLFFILFWRYAWQLSGLILGSVLGNHSWKDSEDHAGCQKSKMVRLCARKVPLLCNLSSPRVRHLYWETPDFSLYLSFSLFSSFLHPLHCLLSPQTTSMRTWRQKDIKKAFIRAQSCWHLS